MAHLYTAPAPRLRTTHVAFTLLPFALAVGFAVFAALTQPNPEIYRTNAYAWGGAVMIAPALFVLARRLGRQPLNHWWRLFWTFGLLLLLAYGIEILGWQHLWRPDLVAAQFGLIGAVVLWGLEAVWVIDVLMAWNRYDWARAEGRYAWWQGCVGAYVFVCFVVLLLRVGKDVESHALGGLLLLTMAVALVLRWYDGREA